MSTNTEAQKTGTAKFVRRADSTWVGDARLYKLDPPLFGNVVNAVVSAVEVEPDPMLGAIAQILGVDSASINGGTETLLVPVDDAGEDDKALNDEHAQDLIRLVSSSAPSHEEFLAKIGYEVQA